MRSSRPSRSGSATAIPVATDDVPIDLNGFSIRPREDCRPDCGTPGRGRGILAPQRENLSVRRGSLLGIAFEGIRSGDDARISDVRIYGTGSTGIVTGRHSEIRNTTVAATSAYGIRADHDVAIRDSVVRAAASHGVVTAGAPLVSRSRINGNGGMGIRVLGAGGSVRGHVLAGNGDLALRAEHVVFTDNMVSQNALGLVLNDGYASVVGGNAFAQSPLVDVGSPRNALVVDNAIHGNVNANSDSGTNGNVLGQVGGSSITGGEAIDPSVCDGTLGCPSRAAAPRRSDDDQPVRRIGYAAPMGIEDRPDWLALVQEEIVDPDRRIVDPHHHFFSDAEHFFPYDLADLRRDVSGHRVEQTVYVQCQEGYRENGPEPLRCVGETEWVDRIAREAASDPGIRPRIGAIVATADLRLGRRVREVLEAHAAASPLFRGIRDGAAFDPTGAAACMADGPALYADPAFREGFAVLGEMGLSYDAYHYHFQTPDLLDLARAFPDVTIVLDHLGTPLGVGPYAERRDEIFVEWSKGLAGLATCENVVVKLGGLAMPWNGFGFETRERPPTSDELVAAQGRYYAHAIECFGAERCLFESNFPVDRLSVSYDVLWNAFKKMVAGASEDEKDALFRGTATRVYRLD